MNCDVFVVGASRSGTTVLSQALGLHPEVHQCAELHYYNLLETSFEERPAPLSLAERVTLLREIDRNNSILAFKNAISEQIQEILSTSTIPNIDTEKVGDSALRGYFDYLHHEEKANIVVEQTPMNLFYQAQIFQDFPDAKFIVMHRDIRALIASQKMRWQVGGKGSETIPKEDLLRVKYAGHPFIQFLIFRKTARLLKADYPPNSHMHINYEELATKPEATVKSICEWLNIKYTHDMIEVSDKGSSHASEVGQSGFDANRIQNWKETLSPTEMFLSEKLFPELLYDKQKYGKFKLMEFLILVIKFPFYLMMAGYLSIKSYGNFFQAVKSKFFQ